MHHRTRHEAPHGSIYSRRNVPGPGHYEAPEAEENALSTKPPCACPDLSCPLPRDMVDDYLLPHDGGPKMGPNAIPNGQRRPKDERCHSSAMARKEKGVSPKLAERIGLKTSLTKEAFHWRGLKKRIGRDKGQEQVPGVCGARLGPRETLYVRMYGPSSTFTFSKSERM